MNGQKRTVTIVVLAAVLAIGTTGCQNVREMTGSAGAAGAGCPKWRTVAGVATGALAGAAAGSQIGEGSGKTAATIIGGIAGAIAGASIGGKLDAEACRMAAEAEAKALNTASPGQTITWEAPNSDGSGEPAKGAVTITKQQTHDDGRTCRELVNTVEVAGEKGATTRIACRRDPSEEWEIQEIEA